MSHDMMPSKRAYEAMRVAKLGSLAGMTEMTNFGMVDDGGMFLANMMQQMAIDMGMMMY
jgi:hypothetical protein